MKSKKPKLLCIEWRDHYSPADSGWSDEDAFTVPIQSCINCTIGWVIAEDKHHVRLAGEASDIYRGNVDSFSNITTIVKSCITKRKALKW